ncbi:hypothetical protein TNIN_135261 [Trichonephila inaurata madagascariensis]|uniref:Sm domain-containing protein n=1 Tax=Trichonephila inaurata madagascariensis TaxID=2747483 RepID=A0A8X6YTR2_9ARAC|nr:hypothetical protein TNIN_135261 [Trichonephila inaurata madagascariensis]
MSAMAPYVNPKPFLVSLTGKWVHVKQRKGYEIRGKLAFFDRGINLQLDLVEEYDGELFGNQVMDCKNSHFCFNNIWI